MVIMGMGKIIPLEVRYERHIKRTDTCWVWTKGVASSGYAQLRFGRSNKTISVHRWAYEHWVGPIPAGLHVLHHCDNRRCSNPAHLYCGTAKDNARDLDARGRRVSNGGRPFIVPPSRILAALADGMTVSQVAAHFDVSEGTIYRCRKAAGTSAAGCQS